jgi:hypothetical protein
MSANEVIDVETGELVPYEPQPVAVRTLFRSEDPAETLAHATETANLLAEVVRKQGLVVRIQQSEHPKIEAWTLLGSMLGVFPVCIWTKPLTVDGKPNGWEARVEARTRDGAIVGAAEAQCTRDENQWSWEPKGRDGRKLPARDDYALRSMAQTRATSKALRLPLGFIMQIAGFNPTPAEEMDGTPGVERPGAQGGTASQVPQTDAQRKKLYATLGEIEKLVGEPPDGGTWKDYADSWAAERYGGKRVSELDRSAMGAVIDAVETHLRQVKAAQPEASAFQPPPGAVDPDLPF